MLCHHLLVPCFSGSSLPACVLCGLKPRIPGISMFRVGCGSMYYRYLLNGSSIPHIYPIIPRTRMRHSAERLGTAYPSQLLVPRGIPRYTSGKSATRGGYTVEPTASRIAHQVHPSSPHSASASARNVTSQGAVPSAPGQPAASRESAAGSRTHIDSGASGALLTALVHATAGNNQSSPARSRSVRCRRIQAVE